jgi:N6-adenosine-specific RNA methylase IME4
MGMNTIDTEQARPAAPRYGVVLSDPPWRYRVCKSRNRAIENHYPTMSTYDICALDVPSDEDAVLYLWSTSPHLPDALRVMEAWGFTYKTSLVWDKVKLGMGYWVRGQHELLLVGVKGDFRSVMTIPRTTHSRKPHEVRDLIARWYPDARKLEMFAREKVENWAAWGNEVECGVVIPTRAVVRFAQVAVTTHGTA